MQSPNHIYNAIMTNGDYSTAEVYLNSFSFGQSLVGRELLISTIMNKTLCSSSAEERC